MKKHRVNRIMTFILVLALSVSTLLIGCGKNNDKIVLGWIGPLTGENTIWGTAEMQALTMAVEDTNAAGGLLGKEVELKTYDNRGDAVETTNAAKKQGNIVRFCVLQGIACFGKRNHVQFSEYFIDISDYPFYCIRIILY